MPARSSTRATNRGAAARRAASRRAEQKVTITLAHPLNEDNPFTGQPQEVHDDIEVTRAQARHLIAAGYAQIDPEDHEAVRVALAGGPGDEPPPDPADQTAGG